jgi:hypothetical protein
MIDFEEYNHIDSDFDFENSSDDETYERENKKIRLEKQIKKYYKKACSEYGCYNNGYYKSDESDLLFCFEHKKENMYNPKKKLCREENCKNHAYFNYENAEYPIYCLHHKKENMINFAKLRCAFVGCKKFPSYNFLHIKDHNYRCKTHMLNGMIDVKNPRCIVENCGKFARFERKTKCYTHRER